MEQNQKLNQDQKPHSEEINSDKSDKSIPQEVSKTARIISILLGLLSALYFGAIVLIQTATTITKLAGSSSQSNQLELGITDVSHLIISILLFVCCIIMMWASIKVAQSNEEGRLTWIHTALVAGIFSILAIGVAGWQLHPTDSVNGVSEIIASVVNGNYNVSASGAYARNAVLFNIIPLFIYMVGGFILTRAAVKRSFL